MVGRHGAVDDAAPVQGFEGAEHGVEQRAQHGLARGLAPRQAPFAQRAALARQGGQVCGLVGFKHVDNPHQRRVLDAHQRTRFFREGLLSLRQGVSRVGRARVHRGADPLGKPLRQVFAQHDFGAAFAVDGPVLDAHGGVREHADELEVRDACADRQRSRAGGDDGVG